MPQWTRAGFCPIDGRMHRAGVKAAVCGADGCGFFRRWLQAPTGHVRTRQFSKGKTVNRVQFLIFVPVTFRVLCATGTNENSYWAQLFPWSKRKSPSAPAQGTLRAFRRNESNKRGSIPLVAEWPLQQRQGGGGRNRMGRIFPAFQAKPRGGDEILSSSLGGTAGAGCGLDYGDQRSNHVTAGGRRTRSRYFAWHSDDAPRAACCGASASTPRPR